MPKSATQFQPGNPGRRKGSKNKRTWDILQVAHAILLPTEQARIAYFTNLRARILKGQANHMELFLAQHLWGKPAEVVDAELTHRFIFQGFGDDGADLHVSPQVSRPELPAPVLERDVDRASQAGGDRLPPTQW